MSGIESYRELHKLLWRDETLRNLCEIKRDEKPYDRSTLMRFRRRVGPERLERIMSLLVRQLGKMDMLDREALVLDVTFIEAYSPRDPEGNSRGLSDSEASLRKQGRNVTLGYGAHLALEAGSEMPPAVVVEPANVIEKRISIRLLHRALRRRRKMKSVVADSQYSNEASETKRGA